jgi:hypothetical protein
MGQKSARHQVKETTMNNFIKALLALTISTTATAEPCCDKKKGQKQDQSQQQTVNVNVGNETGKTVYRTINKPTERIVERVVPVSNSSVSSSATSSTYVEKVVPIEKIRVFKLTKVRTKYKLKYKTKTIKEDAPNHYFSLLLGKSKTGLDSDAESDYTTRVETKNVFDAGLMYQFRATESFMIGVQGTMNKNLYLSLGFGF